MAIYTRRPDNSSLEDFVYTLENQVRGYQADPFTDRTRANQTLLLALAFVLTALAKGYVTVDSKIKTEWLEFVARDGSTLMSLLSALCLFYAITYAARAYTDWALAAIDRDNAVAVLHDAEFLHGGGEKPFSESRVALKFERKRRWSEGLSEEEEAQFETARRDHESQQELMASKRHWLRQYLGQARRVTRLRLILEIGFPLAFSSYALYCASIVLLFRP